MASLHEVWRHSCGEVPKTNKCFCIKLWVWIHFAINNILDSTFFFSLFRVDDVICSSLLLFVLSKSVWDVSIRYELSFLLVYRQFYSVALLKKKCSLKWEGKFYITSMFFDLNYKQGYHFVSIFEGCAQFAIEIF